MALQRSSRGSKARSPWIECSSALTVMAPVLIIGLNGRSAPISSTARPNAKGFEIEFPDAGARQ
jgi:hypothetical protein